jgi:hypothetical protein
VKPGWRERLANAIQGKRRENRVPAFRQTLRAEEPPPAAPPVSTDRLFEAAKTRGFYAGRVGWSKSHNPYTGQRYMGGTPFVNAARRYWNQGWEAGRRELERARGHVLPANTIDVEAIEVRTEGADDGESEV